jgi:hypothetical protein
MASQNGNTPKRSDHCTHPTQSWCDCDWCRINHHWVKPAERKPAERLTEMGSALKMLSGGLPTVILQYPNGRFGIAGRIPGQLTRPQTHGTPQVPPTRCSMVWDTEQEVIDALVSVGVTRFQRADCSWYIAPVEG